MGTADDSKVTLGILENILESGTPDKDGHFRYGLGEVPGISEVAELKLLKGLEKRGLVKIVSSSPSGAVMFTPAPDDQWTIKPPGGVQEDTASVLLNRPAQAVLDFDTRKLKQSVSNLRKKATTDIELGARVLDKDEDGNFLFNGKMLMTRNQPVDQEVKHYKILDILYTHGDQDGKVPVERMLKELRSRGEWGETTDEVAITGVRNAISNALFVKVQVGGSRFANKIPGNKRIVKTYKFRGSFAGWQLSNPPIR